MLRNSLVKQFMEWLLSLFSFWQHFEAVFLEFPRLLTCMCLCGRPCSRLCRSGLRLGRVVEKGDVPPTNHRGRLGCSPQLSQTDQATTGSSTKGVPDSLILWQCFPTTLPRACCRTLKMLDQTNLALELLKKGLSDLQQVSTSSLQATNTNTSNIK